MRNMEETSPRETEVGLNAFKISSNLFLQVNFRVSFTLGTLVTYSRIARTNHGGIGFYNWPGFPNTFS
jgi:hypothetical protein